MKGLTTAPNDESVLNEIAQDAQLKNEFIQHANTGSKEKEDGGGKNGSPANKSGNLDSKMLLNKLKGTGGAGTGPGSSILSDWDDLDGQSGSNYQHNYFYSKKKPKGHHGATATNRKNKSK